MTEAQRSDLEDHERATLLDEIEQLRTALEAAGDESARLAEDRDRLLRRLTAQARDLQAANTAYAAALKAPAERPPDLHQSVGESEEELRVAFEEMQVLTEELEVANNSLHETNKALDRRVEERTQELEQKNLALHRSELLFRTLVEGMPQLVWHAFDGGRWTWASPQWTRYTGLSVSDSEGHGWLRALHPDDRAGALAAWDRARPGAPLDMECRIFHVGERRYRYFQTRALAAAGSDDDLVEWLGTSTDVDDLRSLQQQQSVLVAELQHRTRNLMGVVQSILNRTIRGAASLDEFETCIRDRMAALSRVQGLLSRRGEGQRVAFDLLLREEVSAHVPLDERGRGAQVAISGPKGVPLRSATVQTLALALHELMTNAIKYGALSTPSGYLDVTWQVADHEHRRQRLQIDWRESGVRMPEPGAPPRGSGYGRELIERALPYQLGAETSYRLEKDGVRCSIAVDVAQ